MRVLPGPVQNLQCLEGGLPDAICCHRGPLSLSYNHEVIISNGMYIIKERSWMAIDCTEKPAAMQNYTRPGKTLIVSTINAILG